MVFIGNPSAIIFSLLLLIGIIIGKLIISHFLMPQSQIPAHLINIPKRRIWKVINYILIISISLLPLHLQILSEKPLVDIILDNSLSMQSEDQSPTRLSIAQEIITKLSTFATIDTCLTMKQENTIHACKNLISLESSGSSLSDALLLSLASESQKSTTKIILTDGGINTGIVLDQVITPENENQIIWIDIFASSGNVIINWEIVGQQKELQKLPVLSNYISLQEYTNLNETIENIKKAVIKQHSAIDINQILIVLDIILILYISNYSLKQRKY